MLAVIADMCIVSQRFITITIEKWKFFRCGKKLVKTLQFLGKNISFFCLNVWKNEGNLVGMAITAKGRSRFVVSSYLNGLESNGFLFALFW